MWEYIVRTPKVDEYESTIGPFMLFALLDAETLANTDWYVLVASDGIVDVHCNAYRRSYPPALWPEMQIALHTSRSELVLLET